MFESKNIQALNTQMEELQDLPKRARKNRKVLSLIRKNIGGRRTCLPAGRKEKTQRNFLFFAGAECLPAGRREARCGGAVIISHFVRNEFGFHHIDGADSISWDFLR